MNKAFLLLLVVLIAFVASCSARPLIFVADQTPLNGTTSTWYGVVFGWASAVKGENNHRLRVFGATSITSELTAAWLTYANGTVIANLSISDESESIQYVLGDVRLNQTVWNSVLAEHVYVRVATENHKSGAITGALLSRPGMAVSFLDASQVVAGSSSSAAGVGYSYLFSDAFFSQTTLDLIQQNAAVDSGARFAGRIVHNVSAPTAATFNAPANTTSTAPALASLNLTHHTATVVTQPNITADFFSTETAEAYYQLTDASHTAGAIRGQLYPLLTRTTRKVPFQVDTVSGSTSIPDGGLRTLRFANQEATDKNFQSFVACQATQVNATANFTFEAVFKFPAAAIRRNFGIIRGLLLELNLRSFGGSTWLFEWFDASSGLFIPAATYSDVTQWNAGIAYNFATDVSNYPNSRSVLAVRVTTSWPTSTSLWIDLFAIRSFQPTAISNLILKNIMKQVLLFPIKTEEDD